MSRPFISAVALYGPKAEPFGGLIADVQGMISSYVGDGPFRPYTQEQVHATLISFDGVREADGTVVNENFLTNVGERRLMDINQAMEVLTAFFSTPLQVRIGGYRRDDPVPFLSRGQHLHDRAFSVQGDAFVLVGWPTSPGLPLDKLRRDLNAAGLLHRYHRKPEDIDGDMHIVVGHHIGAPPEVLDRTVHAIRGMLAASPVTFDIAGSDVRIIAADSPALAPVLLAAPIPVEADTIQAFIGTPEG
jgi:hypothetical protein